MFTSVHFVHFVHVFMPWTPWTPWTSWTKKEKKIWNIDKIPFRQVGNHYLFYPSEVDAALKWGAAVWIKIPPLPKKQGQQRQALLSSNAKIAKICDMNKLLNFFLDGYGKEHSIIENNKHFTYKWTNISASIVLFVAFIGLFVVFYDENVVKFIH